MRRETRRLPAAYSQASGFRVQKTGISCTSFGHMAAFHLFKSHNQ